MIENRNGCGTGQNGSRDTVCIDVNRVLDSCRDKDCFENVRVWLTDVGDELLSGAQSVRAKEAKITGVSIRVESVPFNCGFYQILTRFFCRVKVDFCCCGRPREAEGIAVCDKKSILYGSEGSVHVFKSNGTDSDSCMPIPDADMGDNLPIAVVEAVDPVVLDAQILNVCPPCSCGCCCGDIPEAVRGSLDGTLLSDEGGSGRYLAVSLGFFSVIRIERPGQYLVSATEYAVPDKVCSCGEHESPCAVFEKMAFPFSEFAPAPYRGNQNCGCDKQ